MKKTLTDEQFSVALDRLCDAIERNDYPKDPEKWNDTVAIEIEVDDLLVSASVKVCGFTETRWEDFSYQPYYDPVIVDVFCTDFGGIDEDGEEYDLTPDQEHDLGERLKSYGQ